MKSLAILHEGNEKPTHDNHLIGLLIKHLNLNIDLVDFYGMGGKSNFFNAEYEAYKTLIPRIESSQVNKVLFLVDADDIKNDTKYGGFENTQKELSLIIEKLGIEQISRIYIVCDPTTKVGYLESLILSTIPEAQKSCIENFLDCSQFNSKESDKAILHQIYNIAYPKVPYNFEHKNFSRLKTELQNLFLL
jgi:hypothetical protein